MVISKCCPLYLQNYDKFPGPFLGKSKKTRSVSLPLSFLGIGVCTAVSVLTPTLSGLVTGGNGGNGGRLVNIRFNNVLIYIIVTWHRIK